MRSAAVGMSERKTFLKHLHQILTAAASQRSLGRLDQDLVYSKLLGADCRAWLGLNSGDFSAIGYIEVFPVVGVSHRGLEREISSLTGLPFRDLEPTSISIHLGYVMPGKQAQRYKLYYADTPEPLVAELFEDLDKYAEPFWAGLATLEQIVTAWERQPYHPFDLSGAFDRLPVACWLLGRKDEARRLLTMRREQVEKWAEGPKRQFLTLADALERRLAGGR